MLELYIALCGLFKTSYIYETDISRGLFKHAGVW